jgi:hypothetical protein
MRSSDSKERMDSSNAERFPKSHWGCNISNLFRLLAQWWKV